MLLRRQKARQLEQKVCPKLEPAPAFLWEPGLFLCLHHPQPALWETEPLPSGVLASPSVLAWKIPWTAALQAPQSMGLQSQTQIGNRTHTHPPPPCVSKAEPQGKFQKAAFSTSSPLRAAKRPPFPTVSLGIRSRRVCPCALTSHFLVRKLRLRIRKQRHTCLPSFVQENICGALPKCQAAELPP